MDPTNDHERAIAQAVDAKFLEDPAKRRHLIAAVADSMDFEMSESDSEFLLSYVKWKRARSTGHPHSK